MPPSSLKSILKNRISREDRQATTAPVFQRDTRTLPCSTQSLAHFSHLPDELLEIIIAHIQDRKTLHCLSQVCRRLQGFAEIILYKSILIRTGAQARSLRRATSRDPERAMYIHMLDLRCDHRYEEGWCEIEHVLARARNLSELFVESSACSYTPEMRSSDGMGWNSIEECLYAGLREAKRGCGNCDRGRKSLHCCLEPTRGLAHLSKLTLHLASQQSRFWDAVERWNDIMALSTLQDLTISCACVHDGMKTRGRKTTALKRLTLIECNITIAGFLVLLSMPEALEELHLAENHWRLDEGIDIPAGTNQPYNVLTYRSPTSFLDALEFQHDSLRRLSYDVSFNEGIPRKNLRGARFDRFKYLEEVSLGNPPESFERAIFETYTPPQLRSVRLVLDSERWLTLEYKAKKLVNAGQMRTHDILLRAGLLMYACETALQILEALHVVIIDSPDRITKPAAERVLHAGRQWWRRGVKLFVYVRESSDCVPPYLYDDTPPKDLLVFEGGRGFVSDVFAFDGGLEEVDWSEDVNSQ